MPAFDDEEDDSTFVQRHRGLVIIAVLLVLGVGIYFAVKALSHGVQSRSSDIMTISLPPLPPPPPPPPRNTPTPPPQQQPTPEQQEQKMEQQQPVQEEKKEEAPKDKPPDAPAPLGTSITGPGGGQDLGLSSGLGGGGGWGRGGPGGTKYGWYATEVQKSIAEALRKNPQTRKASMNVVVRIWPDSTGRITKVRVSSQGIDDKTRQALQDEVLNGLQLTDPPPADMPLPIVMRLSATRPQ
ncbi:MAG TPA: hypothetical protein VHY22_05185 [Chthoniobacteraceae bacterium]|jgi:hypothetical protein|nr:hypothetical protein [Chthoniobacteraceae bacterium]